MAPTLAGVFAAELRGRGMALALASSDAGEELELVEFVFQLPAPRRRRRAAALGLGVDTSNVVTEIVANTPAERHAAEIQLGDRSPSTACRRRRRRHRRNCRAESRR